MNQLETPELFQSDDDDAKMRAKLLTIEMVSVRQFVQGQGTSIPRKYAITEMNTIEQLFGELGAGSFEVIGRDQARQIVRRVKHVVAPPPGYVAPPVVPEPVPFHVQQPAATGGSGDNQVLIAIIQLMGSQMQMTAQMVTGMLQMNGQNSREHVQAMGSMFNGFATAQTGLLKEVMARAGSDDPQGAFLKGIETATEIRRGIDDQNKGDADDSSSITETISAVAQGVQLAQTLGVLPGGNGSGPGPTPSPPS
jgi:hypothetical protein